MGFEVGTQPGTVVLVVGDGELAGALADAVDRALAGLQPVVGQVVGHIRE